MPEPVRAVLFDIGGVVVRSFVLLYSLDLQWLADAQGSPLIAIAAYEQELGLPQVRRSS